MAFYLKKMATQHGFHINVVELDIQRDRRCDLTLPSVQKRWLQAISAGEFFAVILTPPCSTWSRAPWANDKGPYPLRSFRHPRGFPWNSARRQMKAELGNIMADFSYEAFKRQVGQASKLAFMEQAEDLGSVRKARVFGHQPSLPQFWQCLALEDVCAAAFAQLHFGTVPSSPQGSS